MENHHMATKTTTKPQTFTQTVQTSAGPQKVETTKLTDETDTQPTPAHKNTLLPVDTSETRWFQTNAAGATDGREALTKEEARARGFHWLETDELQPKKG